MTQTAVEIVHAYYDALQHDDVNTLLAIASEDIVLDGASSLPYAGKLQGRLGWTQFAQMFQQVWENSIISIENINEVSEYVVGLARFRAKSKVSLKTIDMPIADFFWIENGKIQRLLPFYWDTAAIVQAMS